MPPLAALRTAVDAFVDARWNTLVARQEAYRATHGRYWQGLPSHASRPSFTTAGPADGVPPDRMSSKPMDQAESWADVLSEWAGVNVPARMQVDAYYTPGGEHGWTLTMEVVHNGTVYARTRNVGPETHRERPWTASPAAP